MDKYEIKLWGPVLLLRTKKGIKLLKKISNKRRFWKAYGSFAVVFCFIAMILMTFVVIFNIWAIAGLPTEQRASLPGPEIALVLPGINPILPIEYIGFIIVAFVVAIIVHEFSHAILNFVGKLKVKSMGILYFIVPIGAFVEPDEEELKKTETGKRMRVYAAGPLSNFVVAFITLLLFSFVFMSAVQPVDGAHIFYIIEDTPAEEIGLSPGIVITSLNDTEIKNITDFSNVIENTSPNQAVNISYYDKGATYDMKVNLTSLYDYSDNESHINDSFLGVGFIPYRYDVSYLKNPFSSDNFPDSFLILYALPILGYLAGYNPIAAPFTNSYEITGVMGGISQDLFWNIVNMLYWIFWLNLAVGLFNVLPMIPLDGGFLFNDAVGSTIKKLKKDISEEKKERIVKNVSLIVSLIILFAVIMPFFIKYIP
jgi:membrane-associated protease RseP (regulator of RpoE activity)